MLQVELLGHFRLCLDGREVRGLGLRGQHLLAYLLLHREQPQPRGHLAFTFWPDSSEAQALTNLRRELYQLRHLLPELGALARQGGALCWPAELPLALDTRAFEDGVRAETPEALERALALYRADLLLGCYEDWIVPERERLRRLCLEAHERRLVLLEAGGDGHAALEVARRLLALEPLHEGAHLSLMRLYARLGERALALHVYQDYAAALERELGVSPGPAMRRAQRALLAAPG